MSLPVLHFDVDDAHTLRDAVARLEQPSLAARFASLLGTPTEVGIGLLPAGWQAPIHTVAQLSIERALGTAISSLNRRRALWSAKRWGMFSGAVGGWFGAYGLALELPVATVIMLRAIAEIAEEQGEDLTTMEGRLACLEVFALGGRGRSEDGTEVSYYSIRVAVAVHLSTLTQAGGTTALNGFVRAVAHRYGIVVSHKVALGLAPFISAASGAFINRLFVQHFEEMAWGHFALRRLERKYGAECVQAEYERLLAELRRRP